MKNGAFHFIIRYVILAALVLAVGIGINLIILGGFRSDADLISPFLFLITMYTMLHAVAACVAVIIAKAVDSITIKSITYVGLSGIGLLVSIFLLSPSKENGVHLFVILWASLFVMSLDYMRGVMATNPPDTIPIDEPPARS
jgi:hypothetical protein